MNHHASLMMTYFLSCSAVLTEFLVVVTPDFILYIMKWADPTRTVHIFLSCGWLLFNPAILSGPIGRVLCHSMCLPGVLLKIIYYLLPIITQYNMKSIFQVLNTPRMIYLRLQRDFRYLWMLVCTVLPLGCGKVGGGVPVAPCIWDLLVCFVLGFLFMVLILMPITALNIF